MDVSWVRMFGVIVICWVRFKLYMIGSCCCLVYVVNILLVVLGFIWMFYLVIGWLLNMLFMIISWCSSFGSVGLVCSVSVRLVSGLVIRLIRLLVWECVVVI